MRQGAMAMVLALGVGLPATPALGAEPTTPLSQSLVVSLIFDRETYPAGGQTHLTVVLTNIGPAELRGVTAHCQDYANAPYLSGGAGWGALAERGPGVTVPAGSTIAVQVSEPVPQDSPNHGYVSAFCSFRAAGEPEGPETMVEATAQVPGLPGSGRGRIFQDHNDNGQVDAGEAVAGAPVAITDLNTGVPIGQLVTDEGGRFAVTDVAATFYDVRIGEPWKPQGGGYRLPVVAGEPLPDQNFPVEPGSQPLPNLKVSAVFDKPAYDSGDTVRARVTIANIGEAAAEGVRVSVGAGGSLRLEQGSWGEFGRPGPGARIEPGSTRAIEIAGTIWNPDVPVVLFAGGFEGTNGDLNPRNDDFRIVAPVTKTHGSYTGTVYGDRNNSGTMDPGEELGSVHIGLLADAVGGSFSTTTDARGRFAFLDIPTGQYHVSFGGTAGHLPLGKEIVVGTGETLDDLVRVARPLSEFLEPSVAFTKDTYAVGDTAHLTVTLTNRGAATLTGITAWCTGAGNGNQLVADAPGWGELSYRGRGATVAAGETRTFDVWNIVPPGGFTYGYVFASCWFGAPPEASGNPVAGDTARVPGGVGPARGRLIHDRDSDNHYEEGEGVPDTKVMLVDPDSGAIVGRATSDAGGHLEFGELPAGLHGIRVVGPWKLRDHDATFQVLHGREQPLGGSNPGCARAQPARPRCPAGGTATGATGRSRSGGADRRWRRVGVHGCVGDRAVDHGPGGSGGGVGSGAGPAKRWEIGVTRYSVRLGVSVLVLALGVGLPAAPVIAEEPRLAETLEASLVFDRDTYPAGGTVQATVVLTNFGDVELRGVTASCSNDQYGTRLRGGAGWGPLAEGGAGLTIPAGRTRTVAVSEPVPQASPRHGYISALCWFRATGYGEDEYIENVARVSGLNGGGRGRIYQDHNDNRRLDDGEAIPGLTVQVADPNTGVPIGQWVTDEQGGFAVNDVPVAEYDLRFIGPWKRAGGYLEEYKFPAVAGELSEDRYFIVEPGERQLPNLKVSAVFDKQAYNSGDDVRARVTVTNIGAAAADGVRVSTGVHGPKPSYDALSWGEFVGWGPGARIEVGESRTVEIVGTIEKPDEPVVVFGGGFQTSNGDASLTNNFFYLLAPVTRTFGTFAGIVYGDSNNSGAMDPGEGLGSIPVDLSGRRGTFTQTTDLQGRFAFRDIPTGRYTASYRVLGGFVPDDSEIVVDESVHPDVLVRVARPLSEFLTVSMSFTKNTYAVGETAHLTVTLTNRGRTALTGIIAMCASGGFPQEIGAGAPGWGELASVGPGATIGAGETRTFDVSSVVPEGAFDYGYVSADCAFGTSLGIPGNPVVSVSARVPGATGLARGDLAHDRNGDGNDDGDRIPNTKVLLLEEDTGAIVARATSDARGHLEFGTLPAGRYGVRVVGPWKVIPKDRFFQVRAVHPWENLILVEPGANQPDPNAPPETLQPVPQGGVPPAAQTGGGGGLASTGASVIGLSIMALVALAVGLGLVLVRRRTS